MEKEQSAYLVQGDGSICAMPTEELLAFLRRFAQGNASQEQDVLYDERAICEFLQATKKAMQASKRRCASLQ